MKFSHLRFFCPFFQQRRIRRILNLPTTPPQSATSRKNSENSTKGHYDDSDEVWNKLPIQTTYDYYRGSPHKTVKWETENTVLCEIVLCETILELLPKTVLCETLLCTMRGIEIFQNQSYREISPM